MARKYAERFVDDIVEKQYTKIHDDIEIMIKPIPDCPIEGAMDTRYHEKQQKLWLLSKALPKKMKTVELNEKNLLRFRKVFNFVKSSSFVKGVKQERFTIKTKDGYDLPLTRFKPKDVSPNAPIFVYCHGGGFFAGRTKVVAEFLKYVTKNTGAITISIDYRLAPEHPFPTSHNDCFEGLMWVREHAHAFGGDAHNIFIGGDSAGGNLAIYCANQCIDTDQDFLKGMILLYPTVNLGGIQDSTIDFGLDRYTILEKHRPIVEPVVSLFNDTIKQLPEVLQTDDGMHPALTPYADVSSKLPATFITCGEHDALIFDAIAYAKKLNHVEIDTTLTIYKGMGHAFIDHMGIFPQSEDCANDICAFIKTHHTLNKGVDA